MPRFPRKSDFPVSEARHFLEPGPIVLVSSAHKGRTNIMTMGWHMMMEFSPSLFGCVISAGNRSHEMIRDSRACVVNLPTADMVDAVVKIGNSDGEDIDKFAAFGLTPGKAATVKAPVIRECHAHFECKLHDDSWVEKYNVFVFKIVKAAAAKTPKRPATLHYRGNGEFMIAGPPISRKRLFLPDRL